MGGLKNPANPMPQKRNSTSFSKTYQPPNERYRGEYGPERGIPKDQRNTAKKAFAKSGYNPIETQINIIQAYQKMLTDGVSWDGETPITGKERMTFCNAITKINTDLMQYQTTKATVQTEVLESAKAVATIVEDPDRALNLEERSDARSTIGATRKGLEDKIG